MLNTVDSLWCVYHTGLVRQLLIQPVENMVAHPTQPKPILIFTTQYICQTNYLLHYWESTLVGLPISIICYFFLSTCAPAAQVTL